MIILCGDFSQIIRLANKKFAKKARQNDGRMMDDPIPASSWTTPFVEQIRVADELPHHVLRLVTLRKFLNRDVVLVIVKID